MAVIKDLDQDFVDQKLICPPGASKFEFVAPGGTGLYILVHASSPGQGTYLRRYKEGRKTRHVSLGRTGEITLEQAHQAVQAHKAGLLRSGSQSTPGRGTTLMPVHMEAPVADKSGRTLDSLFTELYLPHAKAHKRSWTRDEQLYRLRIKEKFGDVQLSKITRKAVSQFKLSLLAEGLSHSSVNHHIQLMRHVFNLAVSWEELDRNVLEGIELLHLENQVENYLDDDAVDRFEEVLKSDRNRSVSLILMFLLSTGARLGEVLGAEWKQVNGMVWTIPAMNTKAKRMKALPLNASARWVLEQLKSKGKSPYLFPSPATGRPYTTITRAFWRLRGKAGIPDNVRIHDLRHTFASRVVSGGRSLFEAQKLLGHADPRTTMRYAHLSMAAMHDASNVASLRAGR